VRREHHRRAVLARQLADELQDLAALAGVEVGRGLRCEQLATACAFVEWGLAGGKRSDHLVERRERQRRL
jgi:hypothetical protein